MQEGEGMCMQDETGNKIERRGRRPPLVAHASWMTDLTKLREGDAGPRWRHFSRRGVAPAGACVPSSQFC